MRFSTSLVFLCVVTSATTGGLADEALFREHVAPILASHCVGCHHDSDPKGDFSVQTAESFFLDGHVKRGAAKSSYLVELISATENDLPSMPKTGPPLSREQVELIKNWIDDGAEWPAGFAIEQKRQPDFDWWSLRKIQQPSVPDLKDDDARRWIKTPIDAFVLAKLAELGLRPSPPADRRTLIRRLSYDLTGLPPSFEEIEAFVSDPSTDAYEKLVDRLLASPRYGERWAQHWLDVVKYADTCGYDKDKLRANAWPYRDYVIRSFNDDKPFKQFVEEQIAGDVLYPDSPDGILGLGFLAAGPWDFIGHVEVAESKTDGRVARNLDRDDMLSNTLNTFCSVTIQCARCHDHKFDPFTQQHYYGLQAVFAAVDRAERRYDLDPEIDARRELLRKQVEESTKQIARIQAQIDEAGGEALKQLDLQIERARKAEKKPQFGYHSEIAAFAEVEKWVEVEFAQPQDLKQIVLRPCHDDFADIGAGFGFPVQFRVELDGKIIYEQTSERVVESKLAPVMIETGSRATKVRVIATKLAERQNDFMFALAELQVFDKSGNNVASEATVNALDSIEMPVRWGKNNLVDGIWYESGPNELDELTQQRTRLVEKSIGHESAAQLAELTKQRSLDQMELENLPAGKMVYAAATDFAAEGEFKPTLGKPREVRLLIRGDVENPGELMAPGVLPLAADENWTLAANEVASEGAGRAALAKWITHKDHPLTWRSIVNRVWHYHFGRGIVDTPNDFGRMGDSPSHSELLDWLATYFRDRGGSLKDLHRLIVISSVYRQTSLGGETSNSAGQDSGNRYLWKMKRRRLSAEEIHDSILRASGQLNLKMGGPGYYLFALEKTEHSPHFEYHKFDHTHPDSYRRSVYRFIVRSQPDPYMTTLDCADSSQSTPARMETQTPLQSLTMLNSDFNLTMAEKLAQNLAAEADTMDEQIKLAMRRVIGRNPTDEEQGLLSEYVQQYGLANMSRLLFNMSEFVYVD